MSVISRLESECARILSWLRRLEDIPVPAAAKLMKKSPEWVWHNLPVLET
jgi:hypothetical protein